MKLVGKYQSNLRWKHFYRFFAYFWAFSIAFPVLQFSFYLFLLITVIGLFNGNLKFNFEFRKDNLFFVIMGLYGLWMVATLLYSEDLREYFRQLEKLIPILAFSLLGFMQGKAIFIQNHKLIQAFILGAFSSVCFVLLKIIIDFPNGGIVGSVKIDGLLSINALEYVQHRTYAGITLLLSLFYLIYHYGSLKKTYVIYALIVGFLCAASNSRIIIVLYVIGMLLIFGEMLIIQIGRKKTFIVSIIVTTLAIFLLFSQPRIKQQVYLLKGGTNIENIEPRFALWSTAFNMGKESCFWGYGIGDISNEFIKRLEEAGYLVEASRNLNPHNQFIQTWLSGGIIPVGLILILLSILLSRINNQRHSCNIIIAVLYSFAFLFESILVRNLGVFPFLFFSFIALRPRITRSDENIDSKEHIIKKSGNILGLVFIITFGLLLYSKFIVSFDPNEPRTYMSGNYEVISNFEKPLPVENLINPKICKVELKDLTFKAYDAIYSSQITFDKMNLNNSELKNVSFSMWCLIPEEIEINKMDVAFYDGFSGISSGYDMSQKGTWQLLEVSKTGIYKKLRFYLKLNIDSTHLQDGQIFISYPAINITEEKNAD